MAEKTVTKAGVPLRIRGPRATGLKVLAAGPPAQRVGEQRGIDLHPGGRGEKAALLLLSGRPVLTGPGPRAAKTRRPPGVGEAWRVAVPGSWVKSQRYKPNW
jgi:hypothetical protein